MALNAIEVFENTVYGIGQELIKENVEVFNGNSQGAIVLSANSIVGDFSQTVDSILGQDLIKSRNPYVQTPLTEKGFSRRLDNAVKMALGLNPISWTAAEFNWVKQDPRLAGAKIARAMSQQTVKYMAECAIGSLVTCLNSNSAIKYTIPNTDKIGHLDLIKSVKPMGDQHSEVKLFVMHSNQYFDLIETTFKNAERLFEFGGIVVMRTTLGQTFLITDNSALTSTGADYTLGLKQGSVFVGLNEDFVQNTNPINGEENIRYVYQAEWTTSLKVNNYRYKTSDTMNGLSYSAITTAANWEQVSNRVKDETGIIIVNSK